MRHCLDLAAKGSGHVSPNPMVGSVIVYDGKIIGEGYHQRYGDVHAEVNAIASVSDKSLLKNATLYVSLEPCAHTGKTPPCANLIVAHEIPRVVMAMQDPFLEVSGKGRAILEAAGIEVISGVMEDEARELNRAYLSYVEKKRPFVTLKWAISEDNFIDSFDDTPKALTCAETNIFGHSIRSQFDAILIGFRTAIKDNPSLTVRHVNRPSPQRFVVDLKLELPNYLNLFTDSEPVFIINDIKSGVEGKFYFIKVDSIKGNLAEQICNALYDLRIQSVLIEGGSATHQLFIDEDLWDEVLEFRTPHKLYKGVAKAQLDLENYTQTRIYKNNSDSVIAFRKQ